MGLYAFFELQKMRWVRWTVVVLLVCLGIGIFLQNLDDLRNYEAACHDPVNVVAVISVEEERGWIGTYYCEYLSYTYDGAAYERVLYRTGESADSLLEDGNTITVTLDPRNPGALAIRMVSVGSLYLAVVLTGVAAALGLYCLALQSSRFYAWRVRRVKKRKACGPAYARDVFLLTLALIFLLGTALAMVFPSTCGLMALVLTFFCGLAGMFVPFYEKHAYR